MIYLYALLGSFFPTAILIFVLSLYRRIKGRGPLSLREVLWRLGDYGLSFVVSLSFALAIHLGTGGYEDWNVFLFFLAVGVLPLFLRVSKIVEAIHKKEALPWKKTVIGGIFLVYLILEGSCFNLSSYADRGEKGSLDISSAYVLTTKNGRISGAREVLGDSLDLLQDGEDLNFALLAEGKAMDNLVFSFASDAPSYGFKISIWALRSDSEPTLETLGSEDSWVYTGLSSKINTRNARTLNIDLEGYDFAGAKAVRFLFEGDDGRVLSPASLRLTGVSYNVKGLFHFSYTRAVAVYAVTLTLAYLPWILLRNRRSEITKRPFLVFLGMGLIGMAVCYIMGFLNPSAFATSYEYIQEHAGDYDYTKVSIYERLLEAFENGRFNLTGYLDSRLLTMTNPYDRYARSAEGINALWDHAYYKGNYYCYYGITPLLFFIYPFFLFSGKTLVPNAFLTSSFGLSCLLPAYLSLLLEITRLVRKKVDWPLFAFLALASVFSSCLLLNVTFKEAAFHEGIYRLPIVYGLLFLSLFFLFVLWGRRNERLRPLWFSLAGLSYVLIVMSRPSLFFAFVVALPFLLPPLFKRGRGLKKKAFEYLPMILILLAGAGWVCFYNYARFESPFEFGQSYQINYDQTNMTYSFAKLFPSLVHFLFTPSSINASFPYVTSTRLSLSFDSGLLYNQTYLGAFFVPFLDLAFAAPFLAASRKGQENPPERDVLLWTGMAVIFVALLLMYTTYSKAGICIRYVLEIYFLLSLPSFGAASYLLSKEGESPNKKALKGSLVYTLSFLGAFVGISLLFNSFDGIAYGDLNGLWFELEDAFVV